MSSKMGIFDLPEEPVNRIVVNQAECLLCRDIIESKHVHDWVQCKCGALFVDGGKEYLRRGYRDESEWKERSIWEPVDG